MDACSLFCCQAIFLYDILYHAAGQHINFHRFALQERKERHTEGEFLKQWNNVGKGRRERKKEEIKVSRGSLLLYPFNSPHPSGSFGRDAAMLQETAHIIYRRWGDVRTRHHFSATSILCLFFSVCLASSMSLSSTFTSRQLFAFLSLFLCMQWVRAF